MKDILYNFSFLSCSKKGIIETHEKFSRSLFSRMLQVVTSSRLMSITEGQSTTKTWESANLPWESAKLLLLLSKTNKQLTLELCVQPQYRRGFLISQCWALGDFFLLFLLPMTREKVAVFITNRKLQI